MNDIAADLTGTGGLAAAGTAGAMSSADPSASLVIAIIGGVVAVTSLILRFFALKLKYSYESKQKALEQQLNKLENEKTLLQDRLDLLTQSTQDDTENK
jgi:hypothetical protein